MCARLTIQLVFIVSLWTHESVCSAFSVCMILPRRICACLMCQCAANYFFCFSAVFIPLSVRVHLSLFWSFCFYSLFTVMQSLFHYRSEFTSIKFDWPWSVTSWSVWDIRFCADHIYKHGGLCRAQPFRTSIMLLLLFGVLFNTASVVWTIPEWNWGEKKAAPRLHKR